MAASKKSAKKSKSSSKKAPPAVGSKKGNNRKAMLLSKPVEHIDMTSFDARPIINAMSKMSFTSRDTARAAEILNMMLADQKCSVVLTLAGSTSAGGCMQVYADMVKYGMVDAIVATGASIVDMDFFEALGFRHYQGSQFNDDKDLRDLYIDRIYDTYIDEEELQTTDHTIGEIANGMKPGPYSSRAFIKEMGRWLKTRKNRKKGSLVETCFDHDVPIFCPAFTDSSAGFCLVLHQVKNPKAHITIDSVADFR
ncbi:MAG: deoxyhypusine synthase family protein, partial [Rhodospirillaceae bacterium]|nr:deoxyhypusine synthase family protein [Rhodospirillaceae bacterium]